MKRFIDGVAAQVIEDKLINALESILFPISIFEMDSKQIAIIAGEFEDSRIEREQLTEQLTVLQKGMNTCKRFTGIKFTGNSLFVSATPKTDSAPGAQKTPGPLGGAGRRKSKAQKDEKKQPQNVEDYRLSSGCKQRQARETKEHLFGGHSLGPGHNLLQNTKSWRNQWENGGRCGWDNRLSLRGQI